MGIREEAYYERTGVSTVSFGFFTCNVFPYRDQTGDGRAFCFLGRAF